ncbi:unannotated protein [freshwater metagenome]|uniref:Unannotated protein n=1 Tax=freshwater metagenome TaxID=449393 RepID=A0A6J6ML16_9ZZZZ|nr:GNAT family N-acetyltransferase [Actinomycetota bacterium]MSY51781.1 GNAT family N-acetyltransferase [Actinomycetota bacterium]MSY87426.1 GNAT family N-acetyltransferase [Actinomycetota bacterium]MTA50873.1 GNAT family N-acetyltransferase [Actinomycetota bacterium]
MHIRPAQPSDVAAIHQLIIDLAIYEKSPESVLSTDADLQEALFAQKPYLFGDVAVDGDEVIGFAVWYINYSTWRGRHGIYLEDLYVKPERRGQGVGKALLKTLAARCVERGYARLEWWVLDWNAPAIEFYKSVGAKPMSDWTVYRLDGEELEGFAK